MKRALILLFFMANVSSLSSDTLLSHFDLVKTVEYEGIIDYTSLVFYYNQELYCIKGSDSCAVLENVSNGTKKILNYRIQLIIPSQTRL